MASLMEAKMAKLRLIVAVVLVALVASTASVKVPKHENRHVTAEKIHRAVHAFNNGPHGRVPGLSQKSQDMLNVIHRVNRKWNNAKIVKHTMNMNKAKKVDLSKIKFQRGQIPNIHRPTQKIIGKDGKEYTLQAM